MEHTGAQCKVMDIRDSIDMCGGMDGLLGCP